VSSADPLGRFGQSASAPSVWVLFAIIFFTFLANKLALPISGNEENYLAFAKQFWNPQWIPGSFSLTDFPGTRLVFQIIVGSTLNHLQWDFALVLFRIIGFCLLSVGAAHFVRRLGLGYLDVFVAFQLYIMSGQSMFGGEHIFLDFEPKTLAYSVAFPSLAYFLSGKYKKAAIFLVLASHFHFLIGGWLALFFSIQMIVEKRFQHWFKFISIFILGLIPFVTYLYAGYFLGNDPVIDHNTDWIYVYFRNPHHLGIFSSGKYFWNNAAVGVTLSIVILVLSFLLHRTFEGVSKRLNSLLRIILVFNLFFVLVAWFDYAVLDSSGGLFLKYYPFRSNALASFFTVLLSIVWLKKMLDKNKHAYFIKTVAFAMLVLGIIQSYNSFQWKKEAVFSDPYLAVCDFVRTETPKQSSFALVAMETSDSEKIAFMRMTEREDFAVFKFVPTEKSRVLEWYARQKELHLLSENIENYGSAKRKYGIDYVLTTRRYDSDGLELVYFNDKFCLYEIL